MMMTTHMTLAVALLFATSPITAQVSEPSDIADIPASVGAASDVPVQKSPSTFDTIAHDVQQQLATAVAEHAALFEKIGAEKVPLNRELNDLERQLIAVRREFQDVSRELDGRTLELTKVTGAIAKAETDATRLADVLAEYVRKFESRLHITELPLYEELVDAANNAPSNNNLSDQEVYAAQLAVMATSMDRLDEALGARTFSGTAVDEQGMVKEGEFLLVGPAAIFRSDDGVAIGTAEQRLGSLEPAKLSFDDPDDEAAAARLIANGSGSFPLDPTLGNAHKTAATKESVWEEVQKGGAVMVPIGAMAGLALLVALFKWFSLSLQRKPSRKKVEALLDAVGKGDELVIKERVAAIKGPAGRMLAAGVANLHQPRALIEEIMYEKVLVTKLKLQKLLPFIAICAASAPLLGLLGTVTGIISTFKLITVFGSGDVKSLSGGISEALITTKFGLVVAIPSLLLHAFLSRKARGVVDQMETAAVSFVNEVSKSPVQREPAS